MASVATENWWAVFHNEHGKDSEEEKAFLGYLTTHGISGAAPPEALAAAYSDFLVFVEESRVRDEAHGPQPKEPEKPYQRVPRSWFAAPDLEKPQTAATRPPELRDPEAAKQPSRFVLCVSARLRLL